MPIRQTIAPTEEPLTLAQSRQHLRVDNENDDDLILGLVRAAREQVESDSGRVLCTATFALTATEFPRICRHGNEASNGNAGSGQWTQGPPIAPGTWAFDGSPTNPQTIRLPYGSLQAVTSIAYIDGNGDSQTLSSSNYRVDAVNEPAKITPAYGLGWPTVRRESGAVTVTFRCGYGAAGDVPQTLKQAMLLAIGWMYENRTPDTNESNAYDALINRYRLRVGEAV